jgi:hypothetical protein
VSSTLRGESLSIAFVVSNFEKSVEDAAIDAQQPGKTQVVVPIVKLVVLITQWHCVDLAVLNPDQQAAPGTRVIEQPEFFSLRDEAINLTLWRSVKLTRLCSGKLTHPVTA